MYKSLILFFLWLVNISIANHASLPQEIIHVGTDYDSDGVLGWTFSGNIGVNPMLNLQRGINYVFEMNAPHYQLILQEHEHPDVIIGQSLGSGLGHFKVLFTDEYENVIRYKSSDALHMHGDILLSGHYTEPAPQPTPAPQPAPGPQPTPAPQPTPTPQPSVPEPGACCLEDKAVCWACKYDWSIDKYCHYFPNTQGCTDPHACCKALIASCLACELNMNIQDYCNVNPMTVGCGYGENGEEEVDESVGSRIILDIDYDTIGSQGSSLRGLWEAMLIREMSLVMGIEKDRITIDRVTRGSVIVDFSVHDGPNGEISPEQSVELLNDMILNTASSMWTSNNFHVLPTANRIKSWPLPKVTGDIMDVPDHTHYHPSPVPNTPTTIHTTVHTHTHGDNNTHTHDTNSDDEGLSETTIWILVGSGVVLVGLLLVYVFVWTRPQHKIVTHRNMRPHTLQPLAYPLYKKRTDRRF